MEFLALFRHSSNGIKVFLLLFLLVFFTLFSIAILALISVVSFHLPLSEMGSVNGADQPVNYLRIVQFVSQLGVFVLPPLVYGSFTHLKTMEGLGFRRISVPYVLFSGIVLFFVMLPFLHQLATWNESIRMPGILAGMEQWMQEKEELAKQMSLSFLEVGSFSGLMFNLLIIALMPALGEELLFRSVVQPLAINLTKRVHLGILITAILFSSMHLQFYGFFPRLLLGLILGYYYFWSGSIWVPMLMHFVNNASAVVLYWLDFNNIIGVDPEKFGSTDQDYLVGISLIFSAMIVYFTFRKREIGV